ncbi:MAG TPA: hypothetical protein VFS08_07875, partial [Gemmatimonadaceae bacterium]|nr:hypothetical protein [Gemmatimonadaceae bacterium]
MRIVAPAAAALRLIGAARGGSGDTVLVRTPARIEASLAQGDIQIETTSSVPVTVEAELTGAPA